MSRRIGPSRERLRRDYPISYVVFYADHSSDTYISEEGMDVIDWKNVELRLLRDAIWLSVQGKLEYNGETTILDRLNLTLPIKTEKQKIVNLSGVNMYLEILESNDDSALAVLGLQP